MLSGYARGAEIRDLEIEIASQKLRRRLFSDEFISPFSEAQNLDYLALAPRMHRSHLGSASLSQRRLSARKPLESIREAGKPDGVVQWARPDSPPDVELLASRESRTRHLEEPQSSFAKRELIG